MPMREESADLASEDAMPIIRMMGFKTFPKQAHNLRALAGRRCFKREKAATETMLEIHRVRGLNALGGGGGAGWSDERIAIVDATDNVPTVYFTA